MHFRMRLNQLSNQFFHSDWGISKTCILNLSTASSGVEKPWPLILFFAYGNKKKSFSTKSGLYGGWLIKSMFWVPKNSVVWADVWELALSWWRVIRFRQLLFLISWKSHYVNKNFRWTWLILHRNLQLHSFRIYIHTYIIGHYNPSVRITDLVSYSEYNSL